MANEPKHAKEKRAEPEKRQNSQLDHEGSAHTPDEFDVMNPQKQGLGNECRESTPKSLGRGELRRERFVGTIHPD